jgi:hypothetical protein
MSIPLSPLPPPGPGSADPGGAVKPLASAGGGDQQRSPLWMLTQEPQLNRLVAYLAVERQRIVEAPASAHRLCFSRRDLEQARAGFSRMIRRGEVKLHRLCELFGAQFLPSSYALMSVVVGQAQGERFTLVQGLSREELYAQTDLDLGNRQLEGLRMRAGNGWQRPELVANFVEYEALAANAWGVHKLISRIKAEEEIWNKVVDEIFGLDSLVLLEKELRHLSRFVKDVFGVKIVVGEESQAVGLLEALRSLRFSSEQLRQSEVPDVYETRRLGFLEVKDYLSAERRKASGWRALKSVVHWGGTTVEIQLQPLRNYYRERERLTRESHAGFKSRREELRNQIAREVPLFGFYRDLLQWLFLSPEEPAPSYASIRVEVQD